MATVPSPPTFEDGVSTSSEFNQLRDVDNYLLAPPLCDLRATLAQPFTSTVNTPVNFDLEIVDTVDGHTGSSSQYIVKYPGWYQVSGGLTFAANATGRRLCWWQVNGITVDGTGSAGIGNASYTTGLTARTTLLYMRAFDYVELIGYQDCGGPLNTTAAIFEQASMCVQWRSN